MKRLTNRSEIIGPARLALLAAAPLSCAADRTLTALPPLTALVPASKRTDNAGGKS